MIQMNRVLEYVLYLSSFQSGEYKYNFKEWQNFFKEEAENHPDLLVDFFILRGEEVNLKSANVLAESYLSVMFKHFPGGFHLTDKYISEEGVRYRVDKVLDPFIERMKKEIQEQSKNKRFKREVIGELEKIAKKFKKAFSA